MSELSTFLLSTIAISLTGVMVPGPVTAATLAAGARHSHAGFLMAVGHAVVEFPLVLLIVFGLGRFFQIEGIRIAVGIAGGFTPSGTANGSNEPCVSEKRFTGRDISSCAVGKVLDGKVVLDAVAAYYGVSRDWIA